MNRFCNKNLTSCIGDCKALISKANKSKLNFISHSQNGVTKNRRNCFKEQVLKNTAEENLTNHVDKELCKGLDFIALFVGYTVSVLIIIFPVAETLNNGAVFIGLGHKFIKEGTDILRNKDSIEV